jgi:hypothetical protein
VKDQYTGDINDFWKYATLRAFDRVWPGRLHVCWMLTPPDKRSDGFQLGYLSEPNRFRPIDPALFDKLALLVGSNRRAVAHIEAAGVLPGARFESAVLSDALRSRTSYFEELWAATREDDLLFFDPDNGVEISSVAKGRRGSSRYVYWDEIEVALRSAGAVCIYQHFPRVERQPFVLGLLSKRIDVAGSHGFALYSSRVAYLVLAKDARVEALSGAARRLAEREEGLKLVEA